MNILLTFDIEIWCNGWESLDADFPDAFSRYVYGRSAAGHYALPKTLEILNRHGLIGVFFVEPLFAGRFGVERLAEITGLISEAGHEVQLHLHPEWTDEIRPRLIPDSDRKRQHLSYYTREEQRALMAHGLRLMREAGIEGINAFRAGNFACNADTFWALQDNGITFDSSLNATRAVSAPDLQDDHPHYSPFRRCDLSLYPMTIFVDGLGRPRHAQIGACSAQELTEAMNDAQAHGWENFVILSHNFELLKSGRSVPDMVVVRRFERLCGFLSENADRFPTIGFQDLTSFSGYHASTPPIPRVGIFPTIIRHGEQLLRRLL
ncbi:hypothetical protein [Ectothiorhodospira sp. BSL-9]|uniref:hypothetical protein n=1 Tax=Ectothiorhodospira sp. BSL-9 TaxID=1442136 RepID=UPI0007B42DC6|nr:hypothetical protein [Ectothiorhodospira sp. BSL-9]ANB02220.1 hypothetical protein ECTOBSL9_1559 [Ectothiorhodospira sp. BSL-9]